MDRNNNNSKVIIICIMANTSAVRQQAAHTTYQLSSPSCSTGAIQKRKKKNRKKDKTALRKLFENFLGRKEKEKSREWTISRKMTRENRARGLGRKKKKKSGDGKGESNTSLRFQTDSFSLLDKPVQTTQRVFPSSRQAHASNCTDPISRSIIFLFFFRKTAGARVLIVCITVMGLTCTIIIIKYDLSLCDMFTLRLFSGLTSLTPKTRSYLGDHLLHEPTSGYSSNCDEIIFGVPKASLSMFWGYSPSLANIASDLLKAKRALLWMRKKDK